MVQTTTSNASEEIPIESLRQSDQLNDINSQEDGANNSTLPPKNAGSILVAIYNNTNAKRENRVAPHDAEQSHQIEYPRLQSLPSSKSENNNISTVRSTTATTSRSAGALHTVQVSDRRLNLNQQPSNVENREMFSSSSLSAIQFDNLLSPTNSVDETEKNGNSNERVPRFPDWTRLYLFGRKRGTEAPRISRPS